LISSAATPPQDKRKKKNTWRAMKFPPNQKKKTKPLRVIVYVVSNLAENWKTPVTQDQFAAITGTHPTVHEKIGDAPVDSVS
jgi:hypothetical protein